MPGVTIDELIFDPAAGDLADNANVGAFLRASDGTLLTHSDGPGGEQALDVNLVNPIPLEIDIDGVYDGVGNLNPDNMGMIAHSRAASPGDTEQTFRSTGGTADSDDIVAANVHGLDVISFGMAFDGTTWDRLTRNDEGLEVSIQNVDDILVEDSLSSIKNTAHAASDTVGEITATPLSGRKEITIQNLGANPCYLGMDNTVTISNGLRLAKGASATYKWNDSVDVWVICDTGQTSDLRIMEAA